MLINLCTIFHESSRIDNAILIILFTILLNNFFIIKFYELKKTILRLLIYNLLNLNKNWQKKFFNYTSNILFNVNSVTGGLDVKFQ